MRKAGREGNPTLMCSTPTLCLLWVEPKLKLKGESHRSRLHKAQGRTDRRCSIGTEDDRAR